MSYLGGFARPGFPHKNNTLMTREEFCKLWVVLPNRQCFPLLQNLPEAISEWSSRVFVDLQLRWLGRVRRIHQATVGFSSTAVILPTLYTYIVVHTSGSPNNPVFMSIRSSSTVQIHERYGIRTYMSEAGSVIHSGGIQASVIYQKHLINTRIQCKYISTVSEHGKFPSHTLDRPQSYA